MKRKCKKCNQLLDLKMFHKDSNKKYGRRYTCAICRGQVRSENRSNGKGTVVQYERSKKYKENGRFRNYKRVYGLTKEAYLNLVNQQNNKCAICKNSETNKYKKYLSVDHCHATSKVRGLLCSRCNLALGMIDEDVERLKNMIKYIKKHNKEK